MRNVGTDRVATGSLYTLCSGHNLLEIAMSESVGSTFQQTARLSLITPQKVFGKAIIEAKRVAKLPLASRFDGFSRIRI